MVHPFKAYPSLYSPVVDGKFLTDQLVNNVANGKVRKNTPISWNYAEHDGLTFAEQGFEHLRSTFAPFVAIGEEINNAVASSGFSVPSDYSDTYLQALYGDKWSSIQPVFGCANKANGGKRNCLDAWATFFTAHTWVCNTRWALARLLQVSLKIIIKIMKYSKNYSL